MSSGSLDILPEPTPPRRPRKPKAEGEPEPVAAGAGTPAVAPPAVVAPTPEVAQAARRRTTPVAPSAPTAQAASPATSGDVPQHTETPAVYPPSPASAATPADAPVSAEAAPPAAPPVPPTSESTPRDDTSAGVRALQEAFALDVAEREDRHRAEIKAMQQSFMADVNAREDRHRAEVQALHQRSAADLAAKEERHRNEVVALRQELEGTQAQLAETTTAREGQSKARVAVEADLEQNREDLKAQRAENDRLNSQNDDLATSLASTQQQATRWNEQAQRLEKELSTEKANAEKAAATAAKQFADKSKQLDDTQRELTETARKLDAADERNQRLVELTAAHEAAAAQLRTTVAEQRVERERVTGERDEARQSALEFEAQLRTAEFEAEQAAEEATRQQTDLLRKLEDAEEKAARVAGQAAVHEATVGELRNATSESDAELKRVGAARDSAQRRVKELESEVSRLQRAVQIARDAVAAGLAEEPDLADTAEVEEEHDAADELPEAIEMSDDKPLSLAEEIDLVAWQREALAAWSARGRRGVIEAISGADITPVAYWAIADALDAELKVLVITAAENVEAWFNGLRAALPINRVGKASVGPHERHAAYDVVVSTVQQAAQESPFGSTADVLIVADQVHEYGTRGHSPALDPEYSWRLGLTDLYERGDNGISTYLDPYFGGVSFSLGYDRALEDEVISPYEIAVVSVRLNNAEQAEYDALGKQTKDLAATLVGEFAVPPTDKFGEAVAALAGGRLGPARNAAKAYQKAVAKRSELVANASGKSPVLRALAGRIRAGESALIFAQNSQAAAHATKVLGGDGCATRALSGGSDRGFLGRRGDSQDEVVLLAGTRAVVDSGRVPDIDLGIVIGASGSNRQVMERLGQVVRPNDAGRQGRLVTVFVQGTDEDDGSDPDSAVNTHAAVLSHLDGADSDALLGFLAPKTDSEAEAPETGK